MANKSRLKDCPSVTDGHGLWPRHDIVVLRCGLGRTLVKEWSPRLGQPSLDTICV